MVWRVKSYMCVEFGPMRTHKEVFWRAFGIADPNCGIADPMDTANNSLTKPEDNGILNNKTKATTSQLKKNLNQSEESISLTSKASVSNFKEHYPRTT